MNMRKTLNSFLLMAVLFSLSGLNAPFAQAAGSVTSLASASISADTASSGSFVSLPNLVITEGAAADIQIGTLTWTLPAGFALDTTASSTVTYGGNNLAGSASVNYPDSTHFSVEITATSATSSIMTIGGATPLKVKASSGALTSGNITLSSGTITGLSSSTNFGTLTKTVGAANKLEFTTQPPANVNVNQIFAASVGVKDQFGNLIAGDNGRSISLGASLASGTTGTLMGTLNKTNLAGIAAFSDLKFNAQGQLQLTAQTLGLNAALSSIITFSQATSTPPTPTPPPPVLIELKNGTLVMVEGDSTVYMVVNGTLRPFNSEAIFHARGKKFKDIRKLQREIFKRLLIGKPVGQSDDDDDRDDNNNTQTPPPAPSPAPATTTVPTISGLPEGSVVKLPNNPTVYLVIDGQLQPFPSLVTFRLRHKTFADIQIISQEQFKTLTVGQPVPLPDDVLVKGSNPTVFVIKNGHRKGIPSLNVLNKHGWKLNTIVLLSDSELKSILEGQLQE